jgi:proteasome activator subunit 4
MPLPDITALSLSEDPGPDPPPHIPEDIMQSSDRYMLKLKSFAAALPYSIESNSHMQSMLDLICTRIVQAVDAKDYDPGFLQWDSMLA